MQREQETKWLTEKSIFKACANIVVLVFDALVLAFVYLLVMPSRQGFFCDDRSLMKPYKPDTVPLWLLGIYGGLGPALTFCIFDLFVSRPFGQKDILKRQRLYFGSVFNITLLFLHGGFVTFLLTEIAKRTCGRMRPYFFVVCKPDWENLQCYETITSMNSTLYVPKYVMEYTCLGLNRRLIKEARMSFPSGHASLSSYAFIFLLIYLEARCRCQSAPFLKLLSQCGCVCIALFTSLSRIADDKHHATDVLAGAALGIAVALYTTCRGERTLWNYGFYDKTTDTRSIYDRPLLSQEL